MIPEETHVHGYCRGCNRPLPEGQLYCDAVCRRLAENADEYQAGEDDGNPDYRHARRHAIGTEIDAGETFLSW